MEFSAVLETVIVTAAWAFLAIYHLKLFFKVKRQPLTTAIGITNHARQMWVKGVIRDKRDIMAVQTLRNQVMAATFLASTAICRTRSMCLGPGLKRCGCSS